MWDRHTRKTLRHLGSARSSAVMQLGSTQAPVARADQTVLRVGSWHSLSWVHRQPPCYTATVTMWLASTSTSSMLLTWPSRRYLRTALQCLSHSPVLRSTAISRASTLRLADTTTRSSTGSYRQQKQQQQATDNRCRCIQEGRPSRRFALPGQHSCSALCAGVVMRTGAQPNPQPR
jgi:hypothetical protein